MISLIFFLSIFYSNNRLFKYLNLVNGIILKSNFLKMIKCLLFQSAYGVLSSIEGCVAFQDLLEHTNIGSWYYQVKNAVQTHQGAKISG